MRYWTGVVWRQRKQAARPCTSTYTTINHTPTRAVTRETGEFPSQLSPPPLPAVLCCVCSG